MKCPQDHVDVIWYTKIRITGSRYQVTWRRNVDVCTSASISASFSAEPSSLDSERIERVSSILKLFKRATRSPIDVCSTLFQARKSFIQKPSDYHSPPSFYPFGAWDKHLPHLKSISMLKALSTREKSPHPKGTHPPPPTRFHTDLIPSNPIDCSNHNPWNLGDCPTSKTVRR